MRWARRRVDNLINRYTNSLTAFMKRRWLAFPLFGIILVAFLGVGSLLHSELAPMEDKSQLRVISTAPEGTSFEAMDNYQEELMYMLDTIPEKAFLLGVTSPTFRASTAANSSFIFMPLKQPEFREKSQDELANEINTMLRNLTFAQSFVVQAPTIQAGGGGGGSLPLQYVLQAPDLERLRSVLPAFMDSVTASPYFANSTVDLKFSKPELVLTIDRNKAFLMGVEVVDIAEALQTFLSEERLGYFMRDGKQYYVIAQALPEKKDEPIDLERIAVKNSSDEMITLDNLVNVDYQSRPPSLLRYNRYTSATIQAAPAEGYTLGDGIGEMDRIADQLLDESFSTDLTGSAADYAESSESTLIIFLFALILVYLTLAAQFESFRDPLIIMLTVPLALAGAVITLWMFDQTLNIFSQIGMIVLIGIVTKNGILIVEFANQKRDAGKSLITAATEAAAQRFRPILMTSLSTMLGALPIALALGDSSTSRIPMGLSIIGGLILALVLTLYLIPALYSFIATKENKIINEEDYQ